VQDGRSVLERPVLPIYKHNLFKPYVVYDVAAGRDEADTSAAGGGGSRFNVGEINLALALFQVPLSVDLTRRAGMREVVMRTPATSLQNGWRSRIIRAPPELQQGPSGWCRYWSFGEYVFPRHESGARHVAERIGWVVETALIEGWVPDQSSVICCILK